MFSGRRMVRIGMCSAVVGLCAGLGAPVAAGQSVKPNPQPLEPYVEPQLDVSLWSQVYAYANRPRLLVLCGRGTDSHQAMDPGNVLSNMDATSVSQKIRAAFIGELNAAGADIEFVDDNAVRAVMTRMKDNAARSGDDASELLKQQLGADQLILIRLADAQTQGSTFSVIVETSDLARGRRGASFPFDWKGGTDAVNIKANARAMAIKYVNDFSLRVNNPVRYSVQVIGASTVQSQRDVLAAINSLSGLRGQARTRTGATGAKDGDSVVEYEVTFLRGLDPDPTQLVADLADVLGAKFNLAVEPRQTEAGRVAFRVSPGAAPKPRGFQIPPASTSEPLPTPRHPTPQQPAPEPQLERDPNRPGVESAPTTDLRSLYAQHGSPRTVVLVYRPATAEEWAQWRQSSTTAPADSFIIIGSAPAMPDPDRKPAEDAIDPGALERWARQVEQAVSQSLAADYGVSVQTSPDLARASMLSSVEPGQKYLGTGQLIDVLKREDVADVAVIAHGRILSGIAGHEMVYTVETVELGSGRRLGASVITSPVRGLGDAEAARQSSQSFASRASSQSAAAMAQAWSAGHTTEGTSTHAGR